MRFMLLQNYGEVESNCAPGDTDNAIVEFRAAAARTTNLREQQYLTTKAAQLGR